MDDDYEDDSLDGIEEAFERAKAEGKKVGLIKAGEAVGKQVVEFLRTMEDFTKKIEDIEEETSKTNMEASLALALENATSTLSRDFLCLPFAVMHRMQEFPPEYDQEAKQLCALVSSNLITLKTINDDTLSTMNALTEHLRPIFKKAEREKRRKEGPVRASTGNEDSGGPKTNVLDFAEKRGKKKAGTTGGGHTLH